MKICVCCCTYKRPVSLGYLIRCFERQTHAERELVILDDAGQYGHPWIERSGPVPVSRAWQDSNPQPNVSFLDMSAGMLNI